MSEPANNILLPGEHSQKERKTFIATNFQQPLRL